MIINYSHLLLGISINEDWSKAQLNCLGVERAGEAIGKEVGVSEFQEFLDLQDKHISESEFKRILNGGETINRSIAGTQKRSGTMPWGKYKGQQIKDIPISYLSWLTTLPNYKGIKKNTRTVIEYEIQKSGT